MNVKQPRVDGAAKKVQDYTRLAQMAVRLDGWENVFTGLGTARDKRTGTRIKPGKRSGGGRTEFEELFHSDDVAATIAELPAQEMVREWFDVLVDDSADAKKETDEGERTEVEGASDGSTEETVAVSKKVLQKLEDLEAQSKIEEAITWARVFGGSLVFLGVDDGVTDLSQPLNVENVKSVDFLLVFDRWEVTIGETLDDLGSPNHGTPVTYRMQTNTETGIGSTLNKEVHASRFIRFDGARTTRRRMAENGGWADSIYPKIEEVLKDFGVSWQSVGHLIQDFAQGIFKMEGLADAIASDNDDLVLSRMSTMDLCRSVNRAIPLDADAEDFIRQTTPVSGLPELLDRFSLRLAQAARMPVTLMMGMSPAGLNATGESDIRFFYDQIKAQQIKMLKPKLGTLIELIFKSTEGPTGGDEPENWSIDFNALWQLSDTEQAAVRKTQAETDVLYVREGIVTADEIANSRFGGDKYSTETVLDTEQREQDKLLELEEPDPPPFPPPFNGQPGQLVEPEMPPAMENVVVREMSKDSITLEREDAVKKVGSKYSVTRGGKTKTFNTRAEAEEEANKDHADESIEQMGFAFTMPEVVVFWKDVFTTPAMAERKAIELGFSIERPEESRDAFRFRQRAATEFEADTQKAINNPSNLPGVTVIVATIKQTVRE